MGSKVGDALPFCLIVPLVVCTFCMAQFTLHLDPFVLLLLLGPLVLLLLTANMSSSSFTCLAVIAFGLVQAQLRIWLSAG